MFLRFFVAHYSIIRLCLQFYRDELKLNSNCTDLKVYIFVFVYFYLLVDMFKGSKILYYFKKTCDSLNANIKNTKNDCHKWLIVCHSFINKPLYKYEYVDRVMRDT